MTESEIVQKVRAELSNGDVRLWRNNVGTLQNEHGHYVTYGLCVGSSDLIGYQSVIVTPDMVGKRVAIFCALEGKGAKGSRVTDAQKRYLALVRAAGGIAGIFRGVIEARHILATGWKGDGSE